MNPTPLLASLLIAAVLSGCGHAPTSRTAATAAVNRSPSTDATRYVSISGPVERGDLRRITRALRAAEAAKAEAIVITIDSPGGSLDAFLKLADEIGATSVPTVGWVKNGQGASFILLASFDRLFVAPDAVIGASIATTGTDDPAVRRLQEKFRRYLASKLEVIAKANGHDPALFRAFADPDENVVRAGRVWSPAGEPLLLTATEAVEIGLVTALVPTAEDAAAQ